VVKRKVGRKKTPNARFYITVSFETFSAVLEIDRDKDGL
jgi:hypothetical protein